MTDHALPGQPLPSFLSRLPEATRRTLVNHVGAGLFNARSTAQCITDPGSRHHETTLQLVTYLSAAIRELEAARAIVTGRMEGGEVTR